jgi:hypothetical protein
VPGRPVHALMVSARLSEEPIFNMATEKFTILTPRTTANPQIPIIAIAVQKRTSARIATNLSTIVHCDGTRSDNSRISGI